MGECQQIEWHLSLFWLLPGLPWQQVSDCQHWGWVDAEIGSLDVLMMHQPQDTAPWMTDCVKVSVDTSGCYLKGLCQHEDWEGCVHKIWRTGLRFGGQCTYIGAMSVWHLNKNVAL